MPKRWTRLKQNRTPRFTKYNMSDAHIGAGTTKNAAHYSRNFRSRKKKKIYSSEVHIFNQGPEHKRTIFACTKDYLESKRTNSLDPENRYILLKTGQPSRLTNTRRNTSQAVKPRRLSGLHSMRLHFSRQNDYLQKKVPDERYIKK